MHLKRWRKNCTSLRDRVVIDTNTFVSAILNRSSVPANAISKALLTADVLRSVDTWQELEDVLLRDKFDRYHALGLRIEYLEDLRQAVEVISVSMRSNFCRDPKDNKFLDLAVDGNADVIVTGDYDLLALNPFQNIVIMTPADYLLR